MGMAVGRRRRLVAATAGPVLYLSVAEGPVPVLLATRAQPCPRLRGTPRYPRWLAALHYDVTVDAVGAGAAVDNLSEANHAPP
ncbi:hypothetical protein QFZ68_005715 [Streptomyces sp. V1I6]|nr:hypothetical protein [Streptomyces sp. V1I6]